jgi:hypothetical protein
MSNPVAIRYDFDGYGYKYMDSGSGSDWQTRVEGEPLYTHSAKTLTDEEIENIYWSLDSTGYDGTFSFIDFAREILRKEQEK